MFSSGFLELVVELVSTYFAKAWTGDLQEVSSTEAEESQSSEIRDPGHPSGPYPADRRTGLVDLRDPEGIDCGERMPKSE